LDQASRYPWLVRAEKFGRWVEDAFLVVFLIGLMLLATAQIFLRNVLSIGMPWADGLIRLAVLWLALLGAVAASRDHKHVSINLADRLLPARLMRPVRVIVHLFTSMVAGLLAWYSWVFVNDSREFGDLFLSNWPAWIFQLILPIGFALIAYRYALQCARELLVPPK